MKKTIIYFFVVFLLLGFYYLNSYSLSDRVLGEFTTTLTGRSYEQINNIKNVVRKLDGYKLNPGGSFSFNSYIGKAKSEFGFEPAPMIIDGKVEDTIGGGICQVSSTLYSSVLSAGLEILERHAHCYRVKSVPPGFDAAVAYGKADLVFKNNYIFPVFIKSKYSRNRITIKVESLQNKPYEVKVDKVVKKIIEPQKEKSNNSYFKNQFISYNNESKGAIIEVKRLFYKKGDLVKEEVISNDLYL